MEHLIKPRIAPRDMIDILIGLPVSLFSATILFGVPTIVAVLLTRSTWIGFLVFCLAYSIALLFTVWKLTVDANGIAFHRFFGTPKTLPWSKIESIEEVCRTEIVIKGWLWPLFPPREITPSFSAKQHFRITWREGFCYFPPNDIALFEELSEQYMNNNLNKP